MSGIAVSGVAMWTIFLKLHYASLLASIAYQVGTYGLAVAGTLAIIGGFLGCFGIFYEQKAIILFVSLVLYTRTRIYFFVRFHLISIFSSELNFVVGDKTFFLLSG